MSERDADPPPNDPAELIARAKREAAAKIIARMQADDARDEREGADFADSSQLGLSSSSAGLSSGSGWGLDSGDDWGLSGRSGSGRSSAGGEGGGTLAEASDGMRSTIDLSSQALRDAAHASEQDTAADPKLSRRAPPFRPERRPAMALLIVLDDGASTGEELRVRKTPFEVGRVEGQLVIPHDQQMSRRHFRIDRRQRDEAWEWVLTDLKSLNGTFLRRDYVEVKDGVELMIGNEVVRVSQSSGTPSITLTKLGPGKQEERVTLTPGARLIGSDASTCVPFLSDNQLLAPQHLRFDCDRSGRWRATALAGTDGLWVRTPAFRLEDNVQWQTGEQRYLFRVC